MIKPLAKRVLLSLALLAAVPAFSAPDQDDALKEVAARFRQMYPKTKITSVNRSAVAGLYEVVMGETVAYTDETGRYFLIGHLFDMREQRDLTASRKEEAQRIEFPKSALGNAIKTVRGDGSRVLAIFSDIDCPYCKKLEAELAKLNNATIYTFMFPLEGLHPGAKEKSVAIWCASDRAKAWADAVSGVTPKAADCANPIEANIALGRSLGISGTPTLISLDGRVAPGAMPIERLEAWLGASK